MSPELLVLYRQIYASRMGERRFHWHKFEELISLPIALALHITCYCPQVPRPLKNKVGLTAESFLGLVPSPCVPSLVLLLMSPEGIEIGN